MSLPAAAPAIPVQARAVRLREVHPPAERPRGVRLREVHPPAVRLRAARPREARPPAERLREVRPRAVFRKKTLTADF